MDALYEVAGIQQPPSNEAEPAAQKRWFTSTEMDLYTWEVAPQLIQSFQLCYNKPLQEHALQWHHQYGFSHMVVDNNPNFGGHSQTALLRPANQKVVLNLPVKFAALNEKLPAYIRQFVEAKLTEFLAQQKAK